MTVLNKRHGDRRGEYVGRPHPLGNPFVMGRDGDRLTVCARYEAWLRGRTDLHSLIMQLRGRDLVCWCAPEACHADLLDWLANTDRAARAAWLAGKLRFDFERKRPVPAG